MMPGLTAMLVDVLREAVSPARLVEPERIGVRKAGLSDLDVLMALNSRYAEEQAREFGRPFQAHLRSRSQMKTALTDTQYCVLLGLVDEEVVGYIQAERLAGEGKPALWLRALYVPRAFRRTSLSERLLTALRRASEEQGDGEIATRCGANDASTMEALRNAGLKDKYLVMRMPVVRKEGWSPIGRKQRIS
jgi:GNAT superfamily N-acetyltransferase